MRWISNWTFRKGLPGAVIAVTLVATTYAVVLAAKPSDPFVGSYRAIDTPFGNSNMLLALGGPDASGGPSGIRRVVWLDDVATSACDGDRFLAEGVGIVDSNTISVTFEVYCGNAGNLIGEDVVEFTHDPAAGTLTDSYGVVWSRP